MRWGGPDGLGQASAVRDAARASGMAAKLKQDVDGTGWTVIVGPLPHDEAARVVKSFLI